MGNMCHKKGTQIAKKPGPADILLINYSALNDNYFSRIESDINYFKFLQLYEFMQILSSFKSSSDEEDVTTNPSLYDEISEYKFPIFIELKILKHFLVYS